MSRPAPHPAIPAEALARRTRLQATLRAMEEAGPSREPQVLQDLRSLLAGRVVPDLEAVVASIQAADLLEEAAELVRASSRSGGGPLIEHLAARLGPLAAGVQRRRTALWQMDTRRCRVRFVFAKEEGAIDFDDGDLHAIFLQAFLLEGVLLALDLGKRPRPLLGAGLPLPPGVGGAMEPMEAVLKREPPEEPAGLMARLNRRLPAGLRIHHWQTLPGYASAPGELALASHWSWTVAPGLRGQVEAQAILFMQASHWPWSRGGQLGEGAIDLRVLIPELRWEGGRLLFSTRMGEFSAVNPLKMLGAVLGLDPALIQGLVRTTLDLRPDPRLGQGERFEPKLKNMYEDAVLLGGGSNITLVEEDDDEPIHLGPPAETSGVRRDPPER